MDTVVEIFRVGGFVMYPLLLCSVVTWAVFFERYWFLHKADKDCAQLFSSIQGLTKSNGSRKLLELCAQSSTPVARVLEKLVHKFEKNMGEKTVAQNIVRSRMELAQEYRRYLWTLGTIGSAAPFLGLFGTVVGILQAFKEIAVTGDTGFSVVAAGISEALVATAAGIIVAIIAVAFFNFLQVRVARSVLSTRLVLESFVEDWER